jgi:subtilisin family serine protease
VKINNCSEEGRKIMNTKSRFIPLLFFIAAFLIVFPALAQKLVPSPMPDITPVISETYENDIDDDRIDDELNLMVEEANRKYLFSQSESPKDEASKTLTEMVTVELVFKNQITQDEIDTFLLLGGEIDYIYKQLSYGWDGNIPLDAIELLPLQMGSDLVLVNKTKLFTNDMNYATQSGRVRPVWQENFAGNNPGFDGDPNITIGFVDSGLDESHPDLAGRNVFWDDRSGDSPNIAVDYDGHGSHVASIAIGTGQMSLPVSEPLTSTTLRYTQNGDLTGLSSGTFYIFPICLPSTQQILLGAKSIWTGGTDGSLKLLLSPEGQKSYSQKYSTSGYSGIVLSKYFTPESDKVYSLGLFNTGGGIKKYAISASLMNYPRTDSFNELRGVAPDCNWAAVKVYDNQGNSYGTLDAATDLLVNQPKSKNIKIINISQSIENNEGLPATSSALRRKINGTVNKGIIMVVSAGNNADNGNDNDGENQAIRIMADPARAAQAITVGASNTKNALTNYSNYGFENPTSSEDYKPDLIAPGGSVYYNYILSVDSGTNDGFGITDLEPNDYTPKFGTSMAAPFAAGSAALVIDAMQQKGTVWNFSSGELPRYVKMILCATATETNQNREDSRYNPTLQRANRGPKGYPEGKDPYEGYGIINPDAAVEAVYMDYQWGTSVSDTFGSGTSDRRAWARRIKLSSGQSFTITLTNPIDGDYDLYVYSNEPGATGTPKFYTTPSTKDILGGTETITLSGAQSNQLNSPNEYTEAIMVVKRISGYGPFTVSGQTNNAD